MTQPVVALLPQYNLPDMQRAVRRATKSIKEDAANLRRQVNRLERQLDLTAAELQRVRAELQRARAETERKRGWNAAAWRRQLLDLIRVVHPDKPSKSQTELTQILTGMLAEVEARGDVSAAEEKPPSQQRSPKRKM